MQGIGLFQSRWNTEQQGTSQQYYRSVEVKIEMVAQQLLHTYRIGTVLSNHLIDCYIIVIESRSSVIPANNFLTCYIERADKR